MSTQTITQFSTLPRVNLLPPEIAQGRRLRQVQGGLGVAVLASVGIVAALFVAAASDASSAQDELATSKATQTSLTAEAARYASVPAALAKIDAAEVQRTQAMAQEVRWSFYLNDLSLSVPRNVWLTQVAVTQTVDAPVAAVGAAGADPAGIAAITFEGKAYGNNDVANWLEMLAKQKGFVDPTFTNSAEDDSLRGPNGKKAVTFSSTVSVTKDALSRRYEQKAGN